MTRLRDTFHRIGEVRDSILVAISFTYALGFLVWSVHAWRQGLGLLPIINTRYFVAGVPVVLTLLIMYSLLRSGQWLTAWALKAPRRERIVFWLTGATGMAAITLKMVSDLRRSSWSVLAWETYVTFNGIVWILFFVLMAVGLELGAGRDLKFMRICLRACVIFNTLLIATCMISLVDVVYPMMPQELGGFKPRPAVLHLRVSDLSPSLRLDLLAHPDGEAAEVSESNELLVFYADSDRVIVKIRPNAQRNLAAEEQTAHEFPHASPAVRKSIATAKLETEVHAAAVYELRSQAILATTYLK